jgi:hypothetical protein
MIRVSTFNDPEYRDEDLTGYCKSCDCETLTVRIDMGIGSYEYWGSKGVHRDWQDCCATCEEPL